MKKKRINNRKIILLITLILLIVFSIFTVNKIQDYFLQASEISEIEFKESKELVFDDYSNINFNVNITNSKKLNKSVENELKAFLLNNKESFKNKDKDIEVELYLNLDKKLASYSLIDENENFSEIYKTIVINLENFEKINKEDIYGKDLKGLSMKVREKLALNENLRYKKETYQKTLPSVDSFQHLVFKEEGIRIFFKQDLFSIDKVFYADLSYEESMPYFSEKLLKFIDSNYQKPDLKEVRYIDPFKPMVALTFDDGPNASTSYDLAKHFYDNKSRVSFFWLGSRIEVSKDIVLDISKLGHEIANHSYSHQNYNKLDAADLEKETSFVSNMIKDITKQETVLIRPPFGAISKKTASKIDAPLILWSNDPEDWVVRDKQLVYNHLKEHLVDGDIVIMHDLYKPTIEASKKVLDDYSDQFQFVTVSEMFAYKGIELENGKRYYIGR